MLDSELEFLNPFVSSVAASAQDDRSNQRNVNALSVTLKVDTHISEKLATARYISPCLLENRFAPYEF